MSHFGTLYDLLLREENNKTRRVSGVLFFFVFLLVTQYIARNPREAIEHPGFCMGLPGPICIRWIEWIEGSSFSPGAVPYFLT